MALLGGGGGGGEGGKGGGGGGGGEEGKERGEADSQGADSALPPPTSYPIPIWAGLILLHMLFHSEFKQE